MCSKATQRTMGFWYNNLSHFPPKHFYSYKILNIVQVCKTQLLISNKNSINLYIEYSIVFARTEKKKNYIKAIRTNTYTHIYCYKSYLESMNIHNIQTQKIHLFTYHLFESQCESMLVQGPCSTSVSMHLGKNMRLPRSRLLRYSE